MSRVFAGITISLDGFVADRYGNHGRLYPGFAELADSDYFKAIAGETGAVLMGRRTFDIAEDPDSYWRRSVCRTSAHGRRCDSAS